MVRQQATKCLLEIKFFEALKEEFTFYFIIMMFDKPLSHHFTHCVNSFHRPSVKQLFYSHTKNLKNWLYWKQPKAKKQTMNHLLQNVIPNLYPNVLEMDMDNDIDIIDFSDDENEIEGVDADQNVRFFDLVSNIDVEEYRYVVKWKADFKQLWKNQVKKQTFVVAAKIVFKQ